MACSRWQLAAPMGEPEDDPDSAGLEPLSVEELRTLIRRAGLSDAGLVERDQLRERAREARERLRNPSDVRVLPAYSTAPRPSP